MPRPRKPENRGLPARWRKAHGAYYFQVPPGLEDAWDGKRLFRLGATLPDAYHAWAARISLPDKARTIDELLDRYAAEVVPTKALTTQTGNRIHIAQLRKVFGKMPLPAIKPRHVYQYVDKREAKDTAPGAPSRKARISAHREIEVLSHAFTMAVKWGYLDRHPFKGEVRLEGEKPRDRYVEDWEIVECLALPSRRKKGSVLAIQAYIRLKLMTGMARSDLLRLTSNHIRDDGIHIQRHKTARSTGKRTIYEWDDYKDPGTGQPVLGALRRAVEQAKSVRPTLSPFLFANRRGDSYISEVTGEAHGWDSMWQRFMDRVLAQTKVTKRFTEHDLRAKCASDAESLEHARALLSHADARTTEAIYRRKPERVRPLGLAE
jgi:integrase